MSHQQKCFLLHGSESFASASEGQVNHIKTIFIVDDSEVNLTMAARVLDDEYRVVTLPSAMKMFSFLEKMTPNLILLDVGMPGLSGFEAIKRLKSNPAHANIPVIFLTGLNDSASEAQGIELGAVDFITKPFSETVLRTRLKTHMGLDKLIKERTQQLSERTQQLFSLQNNIIFTLADLVESRDVNTGGHIDRTTVYLKILTDAMLTREVYLDKICRWNMETFISSARLHDLGKILVPDSILNKAGPLTEEEFEVIKLHPSEGEQIIVQMIERTGESDFLSCARLTTAHHHERWDGTGYPIGLKGEAIPLQGRIMAIVDVYDALTNNRPYKKALAHEQALAVIKSHAGTHFDPHVAEVFLEYEAEIKNAALGNDLIPVMP